MFGVVGFMAMYLVFAIIVGIYRLLIHFLSRNKTSEDVKSIEDENK